MAQHLDQQVRATAERFSSLSAVIKVQHGEEEVSLPTTRQLVAWQTIGRLSAEERLLLLVDVLKDVESRDDLPDEAEIFMGATAVDSLLTAVIAHRVDGQALVEQENRNLDLFEFQHNPAA